MKTGIRQFQHADLGPLQRLICETIDFSYASVYPPRGVAFFKDFHDERNILERCRAGMTLVAEDDGELIATGSLVNDEILAVFVHPKSQRSGYGKALMSVLEDEARSAGIREARLSVSRPSRRFYEGLGYEIAEACSKNVGDGQRLDFWKAKKRLVPFDPNRPSTS